MKEKIIREGNQTRHRARGLIFFCLYLSFSLTGCVIFPQDGLSQLRELPGAQARHSMEAKYHYTLGVLYLLNDRPAEAGREFLQALSFDPASGYLAAEVAGFFLRLGDGERARMICTQYLANFPDNTEVRLVLGDIFRRRNDFPAALREYRRVLEREPENITALLQLAETHRDSRDFPAAVAAYERILSRKPDHLLAAYYLARVHLAGNNQEAAEVWLKKTLDISPSFEPALLELAHLYERRGNIKEALATYNRYLEQYEDAVEVRLRVAELLLRERRFPEMRAMLAQVEIRDPRNRYLRFLRAMMLHEEDQHEEAQVILQDYLAEFANDDRARFLLGLGFSQRQRHEEAWEEFARIPSSAEVYVKAQVQMALILERQEKIREAIHILKETLKIRRNPLLLGFLATLKEKAGETKEAERILLAGIEEFRDNIELRYNLGVIYEKTGRLAPAIEQMRAILQMDPANAEAMNFIGYSWADRGIHLEEAEQLIKRALELKPDSPHIIDSLGWVYFRQGKNDLAIKYLTEAHRGMPDDPTVADHLGDALAKGGRLKEALEMYLRSYGIKPAPALKMKIDDLRKRLDDEKPPR
jgi:tetratricopeptide (TPR) repeat protein